MKCAPVSVICPFCCCKSVNLHTAAERFSFVPLQVREIMVNELADFCLRGVMERDLSGMCCCLISMYMFPK